MRVLKVTAEGLVTSFRYPFFMQGIQPTFEMPPPATLYGHVCSALGEWVNPRGVLFAVHFSYQARFTDMEHVHIVTAASGKLKDTSYPKVLEGGINPFQRELLFKPRLVLYLNRPDWAEAFCSPRYPVALGRSQDLFTYQEVAIVDLHEAENAYLEHTLVPYDFARYTGKGIAVLMPRFLDYSRKRYPQFSQYIVLHRRVHAKDLLYPSEGKPAFWIDPTSPEVDGDKLGLVFHSWVDEDVDHGG